MSEEVVLADTTAAPEPIVTAESVSEVSAPEVTEAANKTFTQEELDAESMEQLGK